LPQLQPSPIKNKEHEQTSPRLHNFVYKNIPDRRQKLILVSICKTASQVQYSLHHEELLSSSLVDNAWIEETKDPYNNMVKNGIERLNTTGMIIM
jgi:hypothetical protein